MPACAASRPGGRRAARIVAELDEAGAGGGNLVRPQKARENYTVVGEPLMLSIAAKPIQFGPVNDRVAHCVSANVLTPGKDYPVGEAVPHPTTSNYFYHMVYLPTARSRMARLYAPEGDEAERLAAISRRTLSRMLAEKRTLSEPELQMLFALDPTEVSRFAGKYFLLVDDSPLDRDPRRPAGPDRLGGRPSRLGTICVWLAIDGTKDAMPGLLEAMAKKAVPAADAGGASSTWPG